MPAARFMALAWRIGCYDGVIARRIETERDKPAAAQGDTAAPATHRPAAAPAAGEQRVPLAALALQTPGLIEIVRVAPT